MELPGEYESKKRRGEDSVPFLRGSSDQAKTLVSGWPLSAMVKGRLLGL